MHSFANLAIRGPDGVIDQFRPAPLNCGDLFLGRQLSNPRCRSGPSTLIIPTEERRRNTREPFGDGLPFRTSAVPSIWY